MDRHTTSHGPPRSRTWRSGARGRRSTGTAPCSGPSSRASRTRTTTARSGTWRSGSPTASSTWPTRRPSTAPSPHRAGGRCEPDAPGARRRRTLAEAVREGARPTTGGLRGLRQPQRVVRRPVRPPLGHQPPADAHAPWCRQGPSAPGRREACPVGLALVTETPPRRAPRGRPARAAADPPREARPPARRGHPGLPGLGAAHPLARRGARAVGPPRAGRGDPGRRRRRGPGRLRAQHRQARLRHPPGGRRHPPPGDAQPRRGRRGRPRRLEGRRRPR